MAMAVHGTVFEQELATFNARRAQLIAEHGEGKFAVVHGDDILGVWDTYEDALSAAYEKCGIDKPFMVKRVEGSDGLQFFTRDLKCQA
jgi:hypothetical protein